MDFCETIMEICNSYRNFLPRVLFTFSTRGIPNRQNFRYWNTKNLHLSIPSRSQYRQTVNVWAGILGHRIIGPYFIEGYLTGERYLQLLEENVAVAVENLELVDQHDGCPSNNSRQVKEYLDNTFPHHWIGRGGTINWPARSPDLAPNDFVLWGHLKNKLYNNGQCYENKDLLKDAIIGECGKISAYMLANVRKEFYDRLGYCLAANGNLFEHLI